MVNVTDGADIDVRLSPLELRLRHGVLLVDGMVTPYDVNSWVYWSVVVLVVLVVHEV